MQTANPHACPSPNPVTYVRFVPQADGIDRSGWSPTAAL